MGQGEESVPKPHPGYQQTPRVVIGERLVIVIAIDMIWLWELREIPQGHLQPNTQTISRRDHRDRDLGFSDHLLADLREKGFCLGCDMHRSVCYPLAPNNVPPTMCDECVSRRGKGGEEGSHKLAIVLHGRGQQSYGRN